ncbi:MAG: Ig-like domain-containing protein [Acidimicrobiales bacterium]
MASVALLASGLVWLGAIEAPAPPAAAAPAPVLGQVAAGNRYACGVTNVGGLKCWGTNNYGRLGDGTQTDRPTPVQVSGLTSGVRAVAAAEGSATCAIVGTTGFNVRCWGSNGLGAVGVGHTITNFTPSTVTGDVVGATAIAMGSNHTCAVLGGSGALRCWGDNTFGQLGTGSTSVEQFTPVATLFTSGVASAALGGGHTCVLTTSGSVRCVGRGTSGQLGNGAGVDSPTPVDVTGLTSGVTALAAGYDHTCAVKADGSVWCWGGNATKQIGNNSTANALSPVQVTALGTAKATNVSLGAGYTCALLDTGSISCWGINSTGQLAQPNLASPVGTPTTVPGISDARALSSGTYDTCALRATGAIFCFGDPAGSALGNDATRITSSPAEVSGLTSGITTVQTSGTHACALVSAPRCWGQGGNGQLADGFATLSGGPKTPISAVPVTSTEAGWVELATGDSFTCGRIQVGSVQCIGSNFRGRLGAPTGASNGSATPSGLTSGVSEIDTSGAATCVRLNVGTVRCWGDNSSGQVGVGSTATSFSTPQDVTTLSNVVQLTGKGNAFCARGADLVTRCWGANDSGQLGNGTTTLQRSPVAINAASGLTSIEMGGTFACGTTNVAVRCWGANDSGQLGNATTTSSLTAVTVGGLPAVPSALSLGLSHGCALVSGAVWCWGANGYGQVGDGSTTDRTTPVRVTLPGSATGITAANNHSCAWASTWIRCWGDDRYGQVGNGTWSNRETVAGGAQFTGANLPPVAVAQTVDATRGAATTIVLDASDPDSDPITFAYTLPAKGDLTCTAAGACSYRSRAGTSGTDSFTFEAADGRGGTSVATVAITLVNSAPTASEVTVSAPRRVPTAVALAGADANGDTLTYTVGTAPTKGTASCDGPACTYRSNAGATGDDTFTYGVDDGFGGTASASVTIHLTNTAPTADPLALQAPVAREVPIVLSGSDPNQDPLTYSVVDPPTQGAATCGADGACTYRSAAGATGTDSFRFQVDDGFGGTAQAVVSLSLSNDRPVAQPAAVTAQRGIDAPIQLGADDPNGDPLTFTVTTSPAKGSVSCDGSGACTYRSDPAATGSDAFGFRVDDGHGGTDDAIVTLALANSTPSATPIHVRLAKGTSKAFRIAGVDPNGDALSYSISSSPASGVLVCGGLDGGSCTFTGSAPVGTVEAQVVATDAYGASSEPATVTIEVTPPVASVGNAQVLEPDPTASGVAQVGVFVPITLSAPLSSDLTVSFLTEDGTATGATSMTKDYLRAGSVSSPQTVVLRAGGQYQPVGITVLSDDLAEGVETFGIRIVGARTADGSPVAVGDAAGTVEVIDNDHATTAPILFVRDAAQAETDAQGAAGERATFTAGFSRRLAGSVTLALTWSSGTATLGTQASGADARAGTTARVVVPAGTLTVPGFDFAIWGDTLVEGDEQVTLQVVAVGGQPVVQQKPVGTFTILDDDVG